MSLICLSNFIAATTSKRPSDLKGLYYLRRPIVFQQQLNRVILAFLHPHVPILFSYTQQTSWVASSPISWVILLYYLFGGSHLAVLRVLYTILWIGPGEVMDVSSLWLYLFFWYNYSSHYLCQQSPAILPLTQPSRLYSNSSLLGNLP